MALFGLSLPPTTPQVNPGSGMGALLLKTLWAGTAPFELAALGFLTAGTIIDTERIGDQIRGQQRAIGQMQSLQLGALRAQRRKLIGSQVASIAAGNIDPNTGSAAQVTADTARFMAIREVQTQFQFEMQKFELELVKDQVEQNRNIQLANAFGGIFQTLLGRVQIQEPPDVDPVQRAGTIGGVTKLPGGGRVAAPGSLDVDPGSLA